MSRHVSAGRHRIAALLKLTPIVVLLAAAGMLRAEEITYTGNIDMLQSGIWTGDNIQNGVLVPSTPSGNIVWLDFASETSGGGSTRYFYGGFANDSRSVSGNTLRIIRTIMPSGIYQSSIGGYSYEGEVSQNRVFVTSDIDGDIYGGLSLYGTVTGNEVFLYGGIINGDVRGGTGRTVMDNVVTLDGAYVTGSIYGATGDRATGNVINLVSGQVDGNVYGAPSNTDAVLNNTVNLNGPIIFGSYSELMGSSSQKTGNVLNVRTRSANLYSIRNFEYINFYLSSETRANDVILDVKDTDIQDSIISVRLGTSSLSAGDEVHLIRTETGRMSGPIASYDVQSASSLLKYEFELLQSGDGSYDYLSLKLLRASLDPAKNLSEGRLASTAWLGAGADLALTQSTPDALHGRNVFGTVSAGTLRFNTGSHIDVNGYNLISGFSGSHRMDAGELNGGAFFEYGQGDYDSTNSFPSGRIKGNGRTGYTGLGTLVRFDTASGVYLDAILRGGRTKTDYRSDDLRDASGRRVEYDIDGAYYGLHLGLGKRFSLDAASNLDLSARLLWTHQNSASVTLSTGERVEFESINSTRLHLGARYTHALSTRVAAYAGIAADHEFDSKARATFDDFQIDTPSMRGTTGQAELGLRIASGESDPLAMELGVQGYAGKREGVTANFRLRYQF